MREKFYITTAIDYTNAPPHLGHVLEKVQADVFARYHRLLGREVFFLTGTDEHGAKNIRAAEAAGKDVKEFVEENVSKFQELWQLLKISNDDFIRTSDQKRHWPGAQALWKKIDKSGDIYRKNYQGLYCVGCEAFITEKDLVHGKCQDHNREPELIEEENYFFRLSRYSGEIKRVIESGELKIIPQSRKNEILAFLDSGLEDVSFSRPAKDISWGVPVPADASQIMYVWAEALSNYLSALGWAGADNDLYKKFWPPDLQVIGKDILRFHAAIWPGILFSAGLPLPRALFVHGFITVGGQKMSKTLGNVVDPFDVVSRYSSEALRYYLLRMVSPFEDGDFTEDKFREIYNADLANGLGNFAARTAAMISRYFDKRISKPDDVLLAKVPFRQTFKSFDNLNNQSKKGLEGFSVPYTIKNFIWPEYEKFMNNFEIHNAVSLVWRLLSELDKYVEDYQPFKLVEADREKTRLVLWSLSYGAASLGWLIKPFLPEKSEKILQIFGVSGTPKNQWREFKTTLPKEPLFPRKD